LTRILENLLRGGLPRRTERSERSSKITAPFLLIYGVARRQIQDLAEFSKQAGKIV
jgi:hypothetical protein